MEADREAATRGDAAADRPRVDTNCNVVHRLSFSLDTSLGLKMIASLDGLGGSIHAHRYSKTDALFAVLLPLLLLPSIVPASIGITPARRGLSARCTLERSLRITSCKRFEVVIVGSKLE